MKLGILGTGFIITEALEAISEVNDIEKKAILARPKSIEKGKDCGALFHRKGLYRL